MFREGDAVAVVSRHRTVPVFCRIVRVMKRFVELDDGTRWSLDGAEYPRVAWPCRHIEHWNAQHERFVRIGDAVRIARNVVERLRESDPPIGEIGEMVDGLRELLESFERARIGDETKET